MSMCLNWPTLAPILPSVIFLNYMYLLSENGGHGVDAGDILLHEHVLELIDTSANIAQRNFLELHVLT